MRANRSPGCMLASVRVCLSGIAVCGVLLGGCQSYQPKSLDLQAYQTSYIQRGVQLDSVQSFAEGLESERALSEAFSIEDGVSCVEGEILSLFYNSELRLARLRAGVALSAREHAGRWNDPVLHFDGADILSASAPFDYGLTLGFSIPVSGRLGVEKDLADAGYNVEVLRVIDLEWDVRHRVRSMWAQWSTAVEQVELAETQMTEISQVSDLADQLEQAGEMVRAESRLLRIALAEGRSKLLLAKQEESRIYSELLELMGLPPSSSFELIAEIPSVGDLVESGWFDRVRTNNTALAVERARYFRAEQRLRLEIRKQYPDIELGVGFGEEEREDRLLLGFSIPVPLLNGNRRAIAEAAAEREAARGSVESKLEHLMHQLKRLELNHVALMNQLHAVEIDVVPLLDEQTNEIDQLMKLGDVNTLLLLETIDRNAKAKSHLLDLHLALRMNMNAHEAILGPDIRTDAELDGMEFNDETN